VELIDLALALQLARGIFRLVLLPVSLNVELQDFNWWHAVGFLHSLVLEVNCKTTLKGQFLEGPQVSSELSLMTLKGWFRVGLQTEPKNPIEMLCYQR
jgi:hypothetical protein